MPVNGSHGPPGLENGTETKRLRIENGGKKKKLILNAFVEMCKSSYDLTKSYEIPNKKQVVDTSPQDFGDIQMTSPIDLMILTTGRAWLRL